MPRKIANSKRFINAYNAIDYALRTIYNIKRATSFSDAVRRAAVNNVLIKKYEEKLIDYGRLRNSIVHGNGNIIIAEPHDEVTEEIEHIANLITIPPTAISVAKNENIVGVEADDNLKKVMQVCHENGYRNLPVFKGEAIIGVANLTYIADAIAQLTTTNKSVDKFIQDTKIEEILKQKQGVEYYLIASENYTVEQALDDFAKNRHLSAIVFTKRGTNLERPIGILTTADIIELNRIIDEY